MNTEYKQTPDFEREMLFTTRDNSDGELRMAGFHTRVVISTWGPGGIAISPHQARSLALALLTWAEGK